MSIWPRPNVTSGEKSWTRTYVSRSKHGQSHTGTLFSASPSQRPGFKMAKFRDAAAYDASSRAGYTMLPWRFIQLAQAGDAYVATNMAGEYITLPKDTLQR